MRKRWQQVQSIILSYLATIIGLPVIYSSDQQLPIFNGFIDIWWQTIVYTFPMILVIELKGDSSL
ncbi:hypothetical protein [Enterococcus faecalis]|uniref:hypothetical protein n=1 Tax=Enterococcus faecalis TaxID=1351 RepID=UPI002DBD040F|nr:hypothetical protein [Enterococcus faecalis]MEB7776252.1 hypothetical protein [Enterococcus faecalis]